MTDESGGRALAISAWERQEIRERARALARDNAAAREIREMFVDRIRIDDLYARALMSASGVRRDAAGAIVPLRRALKYALRMRSVMSPNRRNEMGRLAKEAYAALVRLEQHLR